LSADSTGWSDAATNVLAGLTADGIIGTPQAQAAAQSNLFGVSASGLSLGGFNIPITTLVLGAVVAIAVIYLARGR
jgi:hypothetical protein